MKNTLFINLFGGPGVGKSTLCAMIFSDLKIRGIETEMALEYAKDVVWEENYKKLSNQVYIFGKQHNRIYRLNGKVDVVITDSPLLNSIIYDETDNQELKALVLGEFKKMNTLNFYVERSFEYSQNGRVQDYEAALEKDRIYKQLLDENNIPYIKIQSGNKSLSLIIEEILDKWKGTQ
jgi:adenylate kinase family enzyme